MDMYRISDRISAAVWENTNDGMAISDERGIILRVNEAFCRIIEKTSSQLVGHSFTTVWQSDGDPERLARAYQQRFRAGKLRALHERRLTLWNGRVIDLEVAGSFVQIADGHKLLLTIIRDVTKRKEEQRDLKESERKHNDIFEYSLQPMFQSSPDGKLLAANRAFLQLFGYSSFAELQGMDLASMYVDPGDRAMVHALMKEKGCCNNIELRLKRKTGRPVTVLEHARAIKDDNGHVAAFEGTLEDITLRIALREKLQRLIGQLSIFSHDLRSPLTSIMGFCEILGEANGSLSPEERNEFLNHIRASAADQLAFVNQILDWSRLEGGRFKMDPQSVDLAVLVQRTVDTLGGISSKKKISLHSYLRPGLTVTGDERLLMELFSNLISNALKFTREGGKITVECVESDRENLRIAIKDTGIGIPAVEFPKLFAIGEKRSRTGLDGEKGTGFGLPICFEIMEKHGGTIEVESEVGKGSAFILVFPQERKNKVNTIEPSVLIVDDRKGDGVLHAHYIKRFLPEAHLLFAENGLQAFEITKEKKPQLIVTDYAMPVMDGLALVKNLHSDENTTSIPVVIITGQDSVADPATLAETPAFAVFKKPVTPSQLEECVRKVLE